MQNFLSAATGIVVVIALIRGFARHTAQDHRQRLGRSDPHHALCPAADVAGVRGLPGQPGRDPEFRRLQGRDDAGSDAVTTRPKLDAAGQPLKDDKGAVVTEPAQTQTQTLAMGPVASQEAIKMLGTNGGGFFNANSAHPYENPTPLTNFLQMLSIFLIPAALCFTFGRMVGDTRQGWAVLAAMTADVRRLGHRARCISSSRATRC